MAYASRAGFSVSVDDAGAQALVVLDAVPVSNGGEIRRVAIAMRLHGIAFEHWPWSTFADANKLAAFNPLRRVPTLVLDDGEALIESTAILDYIDERVGPAKAMLRAIAGGR